MVSRFFPPGNYLVTGATGMIGSHTLNALANRQDVWVRAVRHTRTPWVAAANIEYITADLTNDDACIEVMKNIDYALLFAGQLSTTPVIAKDPIVPVKTSLEVTSKTLHAAYRRNVNTLIWLSSTTGYPEQEGEIGEDSMFLGDPPDIWYPVGWMTRYLETQCRMYAEKVKNPLNISVLRPALVYGEYDNFNYADGHFVPALIRRVVERQSPIEVWGNGEQERDLVYAGDLAKAALHAISVSKGFSVMNIASGKSVKVNTVLQMILDIEDYSEAIIFHRHDKPQSLQKCHFSTVRAKNLLGFSPETLLKDGLYKTIQWYRSNRFKF